MQFYRVKGIVADKKWAEENNDRRVRQENAHLIENKSAAFNRDYRKKAYFFVTDVSGDGATVGIICREKKDMEKQLDAYLAAIGLTLKDIATEEVTFRTVCNMLHGAYHADYIDDDDEVLEHYDLDRLQRVDFGENMLEAAKKSDLIREADRLLTENTFLPELERIYAGRKTAGGAGHPVHYLVETDDREVRKRMYRLLLSALYENERIQSRRYSFLDVCPGSRSSLAAYDTLYKSSAGGAVVVRYDFERDPDEDDVATGDRDTVEKLCETMKKYRHQVLTVFCFPRECAKIKDLFREHLGTVSFVELKEEFVSGERAKKVLATLARESRVRPDKALLSRVEDNRSYLLSDLRLIFDAWYDAKLKSGIYPQYKEIASNQVKVKEAKPRGSAYEELMNMIGLTEAKRVIERALAYHKAQILFADKGLKRDRPSLHMVFTGNPGTAKTTVARLFASILKENGLLSKGQLVEVGRGDLVGRFVGWTAPTIQKKFKEAQGGVLFIDEAYSLVDDRNGSFGDEAINTIVQEMENHREDVLVIFAGYPDKMEGFLQKNPGLRSRIAFHVPFADYDENELCGIADLLAKKEGMTLTHDARERLLTVFAAARQKSDFGNGRYVRNVIEKARMAQAARLVTLDSEKVRASDVATILPEDIDLPDAAPATPARRIGFSVA